MYTDHAPFYSFAINEDFVREITFNDKKYVNKGDTDDYGYTITNIALEYDTVYSEILARQVEADLSNGVSFMYDYITYFRAQPTEESKIINVNVNTPRRSMKGLMIFFQKTFTDGEYDSEATCFQNPTTSPWRSSMITFW